MTRGWISGGGQSEDKLIVEAGGFRALDLLVFCAVRLGQSDRVDGHRGLCRTKVEKGRKREKRGIREIRGTKETKGDDKTKEQEREGVGVPLTIRRFHEGRNDGCCCACVGTTGD